ncbi:MAG: hypothetical protein ACOYNL_08245 [Rickettsiales bacterium]
MDQGFAPREFSSSAAKEAQEVISRASHKAGQTGPVLEKSKVSGGVSPAVGAVEGSLAKAGHKATMQDKTISALEGVRDAGYSVWTLGWIRLPFFPVPLPIPAGVAWLAHKVGAKSLATAIQMPIKAATHSIESLTLKELGKLPGTFLQHASVVAGEAEGAAIVEAAKPLENYAKAANSFMADIGTKPWVASLQKLVGGAVGQLNETGVGSRVVAGLKKVGSAAGNVKIFTAVIAVGAVAATAVTFLSANRESKQAKEALVDLKHEIGADHPLVKIASQKAHKRAQMGVLGSALSSVGELASVKIFGGGGAGPKVSGNKMMAVVGVQMGLGQASSLIVPENPLLNACAMLQQEEQGKIKLETNDRALQVLQIVATVDNVAKHGGQYNLLAQQMSRSMVEQGMNFKQIAALCNNHEEFTKFADEVSAKQQAAKASAQVASGVSTVSGKAPAANDAGQAVAAYEAAPKPASIAGGAKLHQGRVVAQRVQRQA